MRAARFPQASVFIVGTILLSDIAHADFVPIPLTSDSYSHDIVVEKNAPGPLIPVTTASMDGGVANTNFSWYERGYNFDWPSTGLPAPGTVLTADFPADHDFQMAPSYKTNNAVMIDNSLTTATLTVTTPSAYARLAFLASAGGGPGTVQFTVHHQNGSTQTGTFTCPDWQNTVGPAYTSYGQVEVTAFTFANVTANDPALFARDISLSNTNSPVTQIDLSYVAGAAHNAIFAVSGSTNLVDPFSPIIVTGFNVDLVVESTAARRQALTSVTTASMEGGAVNAGRTWYEKGYYPLNPATGLPAAGSIITNSAAPDHRYALAGSYSSNNVLVIDYDLDSGILTPANPAAYSALSFLCSAGHGPVTNQCVISHANGLSETNSMIIPDWFDTLPAALVSNGDLNLNNRIADSVGASNPRLYGIDVPLANTISPVTNVIFTFKGGAVNSHAAIFAMSGLSNQASGTAPVLSIVALAGGNLRISSSQPGLLQSATALKGTNTIWQNEGSISTTVTIAPSPGLSGKFYRVIGQ